MSATIYAAPNGGGTSAGTFADPASLPRAVTLARAAVMLGAPRVSVICRGHVPGTKYGSNVYYLDSTLAIGSDPIDFVAYPGEVVRWSGGVVLTGGVDDGSGQGVLVYDYAGPRVRSALWANRMRVQPARGPLLDNTLITDIDGTAPATKTGTTDATSAALYGPTGTLHGLTLVLDQGGAPLLTMLPGSSTLVLNGNTSAASSGALLAAITAQWPQIAASIVSTHLTLTNANLGTRALLNIGAGAANSPLGLSVTSGNAGATAGWTLANSSLSGLVGVELHGARPFSWNELPVTLSGSNCTPDDYAATKMNSQLQILFTAARGALYYFAHHRSFITDATPGTFVHDSANSKLYWKPAAWDRAETTLLVVGNLKTILSCTGTADAPCTATFTGIIFCDTNWDTGPHGYSGVFGPLEGYAGGQSDQTLQMIDRGIVGTQDPSGVVLSYFHGGFTRCRFENTAAGGVALGPGCQGVTFDHCYARGNGGTGFAVSDSSASINWDPPTEADRVKDITFTRCAVISSGETYHGDPSVYGGPATNVTFTQCSLIDNPASHVQVFGIRPTVNPAHWDTYTFDRCYLFGKPLIAGTPQSMQDSGFVYTSASFATGMLVTGCYVNNSTGTGNFGNGYVDVGGNNVTFTRMVSIARTLVGVHLNNVAAGPFLPAAQNVHSIDNFCDVPSDGEGTDGWVEIRFSSDVTGAGAFAILSAAGHLNV